MWCSLQNIEEMFKICTLDVDVEVMFFGGKLNKCILVLIVVYFEFSSKLDKW